jgi:CheY-like chemotaxis protein
VTALPDVQRAGTLPLPASEILIVDDSHSTAHALAALLKSARYPAAISLRGREAVAYAEQHPLAGAVIDIHLPDINGLVVTQKLRQILGPDKPIIVFSGDTSMEVINSLPHVGATYFLSKPVNANHLLMRLREWFGDPEEAN